MSDSVEKKVKLTKKVAKPVEVAPVEVAQPEVAPVEVAAPVKKSKKVEKVVSEVVETKVSKAKVEKTSKPKAEKVADEKVVVVKTKAKAKTPKVPVHVATEPAKGSKTTTSNIDNILAVLIEKFNLDAKEVRAAVATYLPSTSSFKKGKKKDKDAPKRGLSAYIFFTNANRKQVQDDVPGIAFKDITIELGKRWQSMSPAEKAPYQTLADADKIRYQAEFGTYNVGKAAAMETVTA